MIRKIFLLLLVIPLLAGCTLGLLPEDEPIEEEQIIVDPELPNIYTYFPLEIIIFQPIIDI